MVLIAVALFAALSYAVIQSSQPGNGEGKGSVLTGSEPITQYPASVKAAIDKMITEGVTIGQINFDSPAQFAAQCDAEPAPCIFHPKGGAASHETASTDIMANGQPGEWVFSASYKISGIGTTDDTEASTGVIAFLPGVSQSICIRLNKEMGVTFPAAEDGDSDGVPAAMATTVPNENDEKSSVSAAGLDPVSADDDHTIAGAFTGQPFGCADFNDSADDANDRDLVYYYVLVER